MLPLNTQRMVFWTGCLCLLVATLFCYWPALSGPFIFDDYPNLSPIGEFGGIDSWQKFLHFITSGMAGPLGRPVSLASFVLNAQDWPANPLPFKITNLAIHLINGLLVFSLAFCLLRFEKTEKMAAQGALLATGFWLLHPLLVSTTAFVVQRMTQLSCLFALLSLLGYLHGRQSLSINRHRGWLWILGSMGVGGSLAIFSKESGALLPLFALCIEATIFSKNRESFRPRLLWLLTFPNLVIAAYLLHDLPNAAASFQFRDFNLAERLMTEARILVDYLSRIYAPRMAGAGLYHDDITISKGLLQPVSTLLSIAFLLFLFALGLLLRNLAPITALGILWFFAGHSIESTVLPLELYYEHRNYLPMVGLCIAAAAWATPENRRLGKIGFTTAIIFMTIEAFITWQNAIVWGQGEMLVFTSVNEHPTSLRSLELAAHYHASRREHTQALVYLNRALTHHPHRNAIRLSAIQSNCALGKLQSSDIDEAIKRISRSKYERESILYIPEFIKLTEKNICRAMDYNSIHKLLDALETQALEPGPGVPLHLVHYYRGILYLKQNRTTLALESMEKSNLLRPSIDTSLLMSVWMISIGDYERAKNYLNVAKKINDRVPAWKISRDKDIDGYQRLIDNADENPEFIPFAYPLTPKTRINEH